jgi:hypothetical protein
MKYVKMQKYIISSLIFLSIALTAAYSYIGYSDGELSANTSNLWSVAFSILIANWCQKDNRTGKFEKPFEFGFFVFLMWPAVLPYYLVKTRGHEGFLLFIGVGTLFLLPFISFNLAWLYAYVGS